MGRRRDGYLDAPPELGRRFDNGALWTGDRGAFDDHGFLVLGTRSAEILKVGGRSVGAARIEEVLAAHAGIAEVAVVGVPDRMLGEVPCAVFVPAAGCDARGLVDGGAGELELLPDERPRWLLARRDLPRGPSGKLRRGRLAEEAARWTEAFPDAIVPEHRPYPARVLDSGDAVIDGCPAAWIGEAAGLDPGARIITLVARDPPRPRALAIIQAGATGVDAAARFILGPIAVASRRGPPTDAQLAAFADALVALADRLPGPAARAIYALTDARRGALEGASFTARAGHARWLLRPTAGGATEHGQTLDRALDAPDDHRLAEIAAAAALLAAWARRCVEHA